MKITYIVALVVCLAIIVGAVTLFIRPSEGPAEVIENIENLVENHDAVGSFRINHWWVIPIEEEAFRIAREVMKTQYPNVDIDHPAYAEGSGGRMPSYLLLGPIGEADVIQAHPGYETRFYGEAYLRPLDDVWSFAGLEARVPGLIKEVCRVDGRYWFVPIGVHRSNIIWYNKHIFDEYGISLPTPPMTWDQFWAFCEEVRAKLPEEIQVFDLGDGRGTPWTATQVFETVMAGLDLETYEDFINGKATIEQLRLVLENFKKFLTYVPEDHLARNWADSCGYFFEGKCAMILQGDWAKAFFDLRGWVYGKDYGAFPAPGTENLFGLVVDGFLVHKNAPNMANSLRWVYLCTTDNLQESFQPVKGSVSPYLDVPETIYPDEYSREVAGVLKDPATRFYPSLTHGTALPIRILVDLHPKISEFVLNRDVEASAQAIYDILGKYSGDYTIIWDIV